MVFLVDLQDKDLLFTYGLFGVQHDSMTHESTRYINTLYKLLSSSADRVDHLQDESHGLSRLGPQSTTFVAYWLRCEDYSAWKATKEATHFWASLPDDAGVWREVMTVPKSRYMFASSQDIKSGLATVLDLRHSTDEGYWGVYRHRLGSTTDTYTSPYVTSKSRKADLPVVVLPEAGCGTKTRLGHVRITNPPNNLCFVREGQRLPYVTTKEERDVWLERIAPHAQSWIEHLGSERNKNGVVSFTTHLGHETPRPQFDPEFDLKNDTEAIAETNQLAYFLDLAHFELAGRSHRGHVKLRKTVMDLYNPAGDMKSGKAVLFVELCILKSEDLDAEYIGCKEGTGLMFLEDL